MTNEMKSKVNELLTLKKHLENTLINLIAWVALKEKITKKDKSRLKKTKKDLDKTNIEIDKLYKKYNEEYYGDNNERD